MPKQAKLEIKFSPSPNFFPTLVKPFILFQTKPFLLKISEYSRRDPTWRNKLNVWLLDELSLRIY